MACYFWFSTSAWWTVQNWQKCASSTLKKKIQGVPAIWTQLQQCFSNFSDDIWKNPRFAIKSKIEKLSWSHLDICLNSKIEEFFHKSKMISKTRTICTGPAVKVESKSRGHPVVVQSEPFLISLQLRKLEMISQYIEPDKPLLTLQKLSYYWKFAWLDYKQNICNPTQLGKWTDNGYSQRGIIAVA